MTGELLGRIDDRTARVVVVGQGYVGLPVAMRAARSGFPVVGYELDRAPRRRRCAPVARTSRTSPTSGSPPRSTAATSPPTTSTDLAGFDVAVISVPTPLRDGAPDLTFVESAGRDLAPALRAGALVVLESTTYPGTTEELVRPILEESGLRRRRATSSSATRPSASTPATRSWTFVNTPEGRVGHRRRLAAAWSRRSTARSSTRSCRSARTAEAELVKLLENTFRHVNIALVNELAMFAGDLGVDIWSAIDAAATQAVRLHALHARVPASAATASRSTRRTCRGASRRQSGHAFRFVELANDVNEHMPDYVVRARHRAAQPARSRR